MGNTTEPMNGGRRFAVEAIVAILLTVGIPCAIAPFSRADSLIAPQDAMSGARRVDAEEFRFLRSAVGSVLLVVAGLRLIRRRGLRPLALIPWLGLIAMPILYYREVGPIEAASALRQHFAVSQPELDAIADAVDRGALPSFPCRIGPFEVIGGEKLSSGAVVLYTATDGWLSERWAFVRARKDVRDFANADELGFVGEVGQNNSVMRLKADWFVLFGTYTYVKRGWS